MVANGAVPAADLVTVQPGIQLNRPTANAWMAFMQAGSRTGHRLGIATPAGGYRSLAVQADMKKRPWLYNLSKQSTKKLAAVGHSTHGLGDRVDVVGDLAWAIANGPRFGFFREFGAADPNHFKHNGVTATTGTAAPVRISSKENQMSFRLIQRSGVWWGVVIGEFSIIEINSATDTNEYYAAYRIHGDGSNPSPDPATDIDITEEDLRIEYVQMKKRRTQAGIGTGGGAPVDEASIAEKVLTRLRAFWTTGK